MRICLRWIPAAALALLLTACVPSLNPYFEEDDVITDAGLAGIWISPGGDESMTFEPQEGEVAYSVVHRDDDGDPGPLVVHLFAIGDTRFLDFYPEESDLSANDFYDFHLIPAHTVMRASRKDDVLELSFLDIEWVGDFMEANPDALQHVELEDDAVVLTGPSSELRAFLANHHTEAFESPDAWTRRPAEPAAEAESAR